MSTRDVRTLTKDGIYTPFQHTYIPPHTRRPIVIANTEIDAEEPPASIVLGRWRYALVGEVDGASERTVADEG